MNKRIAIFPGSFDPFTNGHLDTVRRGSKLFDEIIIAVSTNTAKKALFSESEKLAGISEAVASLANVQVIAHGQGLTVDLAKKLQATTMLRGLRSNRDFEYEREIERMNKALMPELETVFLLADEHYSFISSSLIKEVARFDGDISEMVPPAINQQLKDKFESS